MFLIADTVAGHFPVVAWMPKQGPWLATRSGYGPFAANPQSMGAQLSFLLNPGTRGGQVEPCWASGPPAPTAFHLLFQTDKHEITSID